MFLLIPIANPSKVGLYLPALATILFPFLQTLTMTRWMYCPRYLPHALTDSWKTFRKLHVPTWT